ncbi:MAG: ATP-grasp domain-containing protein [Magnetococcales bacterium]|nr:ATP-grasp domain-containing protein [Magnetococcales bacterium]
MKHSNRKTLHIAVTGINACDNPGPGIGVARSLKEVADVDVCISGLAYDAMEPGIYMDQFVDQAFLIPYPKAGIEELFNRLIYIKQSHGMDMVIPTLDSELPLYMALQERLLKQGIHAFLPSPEQFALRGKDRLQEAAACSGICSPVQEAVHSFEELAIATGKIGFPVMVKGAIYDAYHVENLDEAVTAFSRIVARFGYPVIVQQAIRGEQMNVICVGDGDGDSLGMVGVKKMSTTEKGKIWTGVTIHNDRVMEATRQFVQKTKWRSAFEMECIVDDEQVYLIEVNPRFPAWVYFATGIGINLPERMMRKTLGQSYSQSTSYASGQLYVRYTQERICDMSRFQNMVTRGQS